MTTATATARGPDVTDRSRAGRPPRRRDPSKASGWVTFAMVSPFVVGLAAFVVYPVFATLYYSLTNFQEGSYRPVKFVGLQNYTTLLTQSDTFWLAVRN